MYNVNFDGQNFIKRRVVKLISKLYGIFFSQKCMMNTRREKENWLLNIPYLLPHRIKNYFNIWLQLTTQQLGELEIRTGSVRNINFGTGNSFILKGCFLRYFWCTLLWALDIIQFPSGTFKNNYDLVGEIPIFCYYAILFSTTI